MPWDPLGNWPRQRPWIWLTLAGWSLVLLGPAFVEQHTGHGGHCPGLLSGVCVGPELVRRDVDLRGPS